MTEGGNGEVKRFWLGDNDIFISYICIVRRAEFIYLCI